MITLSLTFTIVNVKHKLLMPSYCQHKRDINYCQAHANLANRTKIAISVPLAGRSVGRSMLGRSSGRGRAVAVGHRSVDGRSVGRLT